MYLQVVLQSMQICGDISKNEMPISIFEMPHVVSPFSSDTLWVPTKYSLCIMRKIWKFNFFVLQYFTLGNTIGARSSQNKPPLSST